MMVQHRRSLAVYGVFFFVVAVAAMVALQSWIPGPLTILLCMPSCQTVLWGPSGNTKLRAFRGQEPENQQTGSSPILDRKRVCSSGPS